MHGYYLAHHGILGQKWGIRRFQNKNGSLTAAGKSRRLALAEKHGKRVAKVEFARKNKPIKDIEKEKRKAEARTKSKEKHAEKAKALEEARKAKLMEQAVRDPKKLIKYKNELSQEDIKKVINDINFDRKVRDLASTDRDRFNKTMGQVADLTNKTVNIFRNVKDAYNIGAEVYNTLIDSGKVKGVKKLKIGEKPEAPKEDRRWAKAVIRNNPTWVKNNTNLFTTDELKDLWQRNEYINKIT